MKLFVTGGTGLLGLNTIPSLLAGGHTLRLLVLGIAWRPFSETARDTVAFFRAGGTK
jgi:nucleoside-diphosphate-sugar epimerase